MAQSGQRKRKPGRPPLKVYARGRQARQLRLTTPSRQANEDFPGLTATEADEKASQSRAPDDCQLTPDELRLMALNRLPTGIVPLTVHSNDYFSKPLLLDTKIRNPPEWKLVEQISTELIPNWFDAQRNDYSPYRFTQSRAARVIWFGHPGDTPLDLRARCCVVKWDDDSDLTIVPGRAEAARHARVLVRWEYLCRGACSFIDDENDEGSTGHLEEEDQEIHETRVEQPNRWKRCASGVKLVIEVTADNLACVNIWQQHAHPDAAPHHLVWSRRLRNLVGERYRLVGAKASTIMREVVDQYRNPVHTSRPTNAPLEGPYDFPAFRRPRKHQIENMVPAITRRARLDQDPFVAVHLMQERNPESFITKMNKVLPYDQSVFPMAIRSDDKSQAVPGTKSSQHAMEMSGQPLKAECVLTILGWR